MSISGPDLHPLDWRYPCPQCGVGKRRRDDCEECGTAGESDPAELVRTRTQPFPDGREAYAESIGETADGVAEHDRAAAAELAEFLGRPAPKL